MVGAQMTDDVESIYKEAVVANVDINPALIVIYRNHIYKLSKLL
jgi:hypothetical protein